jgi:hypothetical protein
MTSSGLEPATSRLMLAQLIDKFPAFVREAKRIYKYLPNLNKYDSYTLLIVFWDVTPCNLVDARNVSEERATSTFRVEVFCLFYIKVSGRNSRKC